MTKAEYIEKVKVKLDEISPFVEPTTFLAAGGDTSYDNVKPIIMYITNELPNAVKFCLSSLPYSILSKDITQSSNLMFTLSADRVGKVASTTNFDLSTKRLVRVNVPNYWKKDVVSFITSEDVEYLIQQNAHTRGKIYKPVVAYVPERNELELYSFPHELAGENATPPTTQWAVNVWSIDLTTLAQDVLSSIEDFIILKCAQLVFDVLGNTNGSTAMQQEYQRKLESI